MLIAAGVLGVLGILAYGVLPILGAINGPVIGSEGLHTALQFLGPASVIACFALLMVAGVPKAVLGLASGVVGLLNALTAESLTEHLGQTGAVVNAVVWLITVVLLCVAVGPTGLGTVLPRWAAGSINFGAKGLLLCFVLSFLAGVAGAMILLTISGLVVLISWILLLVGFVGLLAAGNN